MKKALDLFNLRTADLEMIECLFKSINSKEAALIKSHSIHIFMEKAINENNEVFHVQCYISALVAFLKNKGYVIIKEGEDEQ